MPPLSIPVLFLPYILLPPPMNYVDFDPHRLRLVQRVLRSDLTWSACTPKYIMSNQQPTGFPWSSPAGNTPTSGNPSITPAGGYINPASGTAYNPPGARRSNFGAPSITPAGGHPITASGASYNPSGARTTATHTPAPTGVYDFNAHRPVWTSLCTHKRGGPDHSRKLCQRVGRTGPDAVERFAYSQPIHRLHPSASRSRLRPFSAWRRLHPSASQSRLRPLSASRCPRPSSARSHLRPFSAWRRLHPSASQSRLCPLSAYAPPPLVVTYAPSPLGAAYASPPLGPAYALLRLDPLTLLLRKGLSTPLLLNPRHTRYTPPIPPMPHQGTPISTRSPNPLLSPLAATCPHQCKTYPPPPRRAALPYPAHATVPPTPPLAPPHTRLPNQCHNSRPPPSPRSTTPTYLLGTIDLSAAVPLPPPLPPRPVYQPHPYHPSIMDETGLFS